MRPKYLATAASLLVGIALAAWMWAGFRRPEPRPLLAKPHFEFVLSPGDTPSRIHFDLRDAHVVEIDPTGTLILQVKVQETWHVRPHAYQTFANARHEVDVRFAIDEHGDVRFVLGPYDPSLPLVIDPIVKQRWTQ